MNPFFILLYQIKMLKTKQELYIPKQEYDKILIEPQGSGFLLSFK